MFTCSLLSLSIIPYLSEADALSTSRQSPSPAKRSPEVLLTRCDDEVIPASEATATAKQPPRSSASPAVHDESSLCVRRGKRKLVSSDDESSAGPNESCDSPLLVVQGQGPYSVISRDINTQLVLNHGLIRISS